MGKKVLFDNPPYMKAWEELVDEGGRNARFTFVETGPAMSVIPLTHDGSRIFLSLIREERLPGVSELKAVGGYNRPGESYEECALRKLREEVGITVESKNLVDLGRMVGFTVVRLPIRLFYTSWWRKTGGADPRIELIRMSLVEAVEKVMNHEFGDESAAIAVLRLYILMTRGQL